MSEVPVEEMPEACSSCGYETKELKRYENGFGNHKIAGWFCPCCANTPAGNAYFFPDQYPDLFILRTIAWAANYLADKIDRKVSDALSP